MDNFVNLNTQISPNIKTKRFSVKKIIIFILIPIVLISSLLIFAFTGMDRIPQVQSRYSPKHIPSDLKKTDVRFKELRNGEAVYSESYKADGWIFLYFVQRHNSTERECVVPPARETSVFTNYHEFLPLGSVLGCSYTSTSNDDESESLYYRWFKDGIWFELTTLNYDLSEENALKFANSLQVKEITYKDKLRGVVNNASNNIFRKIFIY